MKRSTNRSTNPIAMRAESRPTLLKPADRLTLYQLLIIVATAWLAFTPKVAHAQAAPPGLTAPNPKLAQAQALVAQRKFAEAIPLLREALTAQPLLGPAWMALGTSHKALGSIDSAFAAFNMALQRPGVARLASLQLFLLYADANKPDTAFSMFQKVQQSPIDFTAVALNPEIQKLKGDKRYAMFFPSATDFDKPFVENVRIIHEWRGEAAGDEFGWIARGIGDVDGDGITDVVTSATSNLPTGNQIGKVYAYSGKSGKLLWKQTSVAGAFFGNGIESAGDVNKDGIPDVIVGAPGINTVFVYSGKDGKELRKIVGDSATQDLGNGVTGVGDLNHDGYADFVASAPRAHGGKGRVYVFSGKDSKPLLILDGEKAGDAFGSTVGSGFNSGTFVVGAAGAGPQGAGKVYRYVGLNAQPTFVQAADSSGGALGAMFVSVVGDVDGDGVADAYATDFANSANGPGTGRAYIFSGRTGKPLFIKTGESAGENLGIGAGRVGDVNGDGHADFIVAGWQFRGAAWSGGRVQLFSGKDGSVLQTFTGRVPGETLGFDAVGVGDVDGDGKTDYLLTSAWSMVNGVRSGRMYIVAGTVSNAKAPSAKKK
ncbi:MAG: FG-GAP-like repeat-containing protein [Gemmatimonadaceae bacterium]